MDEDIVTWYSQVACHSYHALVYTQTQNESWDITNHPYIFIISF